LTTYETEIIYHHVVVRVDRFGFGWLQRRFYYRLLYSRRPGDHECGPGDSADDPAFNELTGSAVRIIAAVPVGNRQIVRAGIPCLHVHEPDFTKIRLFLVLDKA